MVAGFSLFGYLFAFIARAPYFIPSYPWLYFTLIVLTVIAVFSCLSLAYVKLYILDKGILIEAPFLNFSRYYQVNQIYGFNVTQEKKQRWFLLRPLPSLRGKKEPSITISLLEPLPMWLQALVFGERFAGNEVKFRPKSVQSFMLAMNTLGVSERRIGQIWKRNTSVAKGILWVWNPFAVCFYLISLFFMRFMDKTKKKGVVTRNQERLSGRVGLSLPTVNALVSVTTWVNGKNTSATIRTSTGRLVIEKNVPLKINMGVMKRKDG